ncbi:MAG: alcohol dehydrogenase [Halobacteriovorax sp.]|nr:alcohol dehydrogenase [Halobacteriovorax sp.]|tara:strand:+ start:12277 stop:13320 length:1044 start_codon:yes stop_codon:yes gene_type:complete
MIDAQALTISLENSILDTIKVIDEGTTKIALVVDGKSIVGVVTDGDIRRHILKGNSLEEPVSKLVSKKPVTIKENTPKEEVLQMMKKFEVKHIPVVNDKDELIGLECLDLLFFTEKIDYPVVLMAGGLGTRLGELTKNKPKPLVELDTQPILEKIIEQFKNQGFWNFHISVNHMANQIIDYFGDGEKWGVKIQYLKEKEKLGTAGALSLLSKKANCPIIVMNADLLTSVKFKHFVDFHFEQDSFASMAVREYEFNVPFGVLNLEQENITNIQEKPSQKFFVNAGIYVLSPQVLDILEPGKHIDMTQLFSKLIEMKKKVVAFPIREYWLDIGQPKDLERAQTDVKKHF